MFFLLRLHDKTTLNEPLKENGIIVLQSGHLDLRPSPYLGPTGIDNTSINYMNGLGDILLHISFRRLENDIVFNSSARNGGWGKEERVPLSGAFSDRRDPTITVYDHPDRLQIMVDYKTVHYYTKRIKDKVSKLTYQTNEGQTPLFSDVLAVNVLYFGDIMPRTNF